jgi:hypothetical protein
MFFTTLIAAPILAGLVAGVWTGRRSVPWALTCICLGLGVLGAAVLAFNPDERTGNITFSLIAPVVCSGLVWGGYAVGRLTRRSAVRSA